MFNPFSYPHKCHLDTYLTGQQSYPNTCLTRTPVYKKSWTRFSQTRVTRPGQTNIALEHPTSLQIWRRVSVWVNENGVVVVWIHIHIKPNCSSLAVRFRFVHVMNKQTMPAYTTHILFENLIAWTLIESSCDNMIPWCYIVFKIVCESIDNLSAHNPHPTKVPGRDGRWYQGKRSYNSGSIIETQKKLKMEKQCINRIWETRRKWLRIIWKINWKYLVLFWSFPDKVVH